MYSENYNNNIKLLKTTYSALHKMLRNIRLGTIASDDQHLYQIYSATADDGTVNDIIATYDKNTRDIKGISIYFDCDKEGE